MVAAVRTRRGGKTHTLLKLWGQSRRSLFVCFCEASAAATRREACAMYPWLSLEDAKNRIISGVNARERLKGWERGIPLGHGLGEVFVDNAELLLEELLGTPIDGVSLTALQI